MRGLNKRISIVNRTESKVGREWLSIGTTSLLWVFSSTTAISTVAFGTLIFIKIKNGAIVHEDIVNPIMICMFVSYIALLLIVFVRSALQFDKTSA